MTIIQQQFFELLKSGLWGGAPDASLFVGEVDWPQLFQLARRQALPAIVLDGVRLLPEELRPPKALYLQWCAVMLHVEEQNELLNREIGNLYALLRAQGMEPVLAKGQGVAQCYRLPHHRQCGDIDLYLGRRFYEQTNALLRPEATDEHEETFKHSCMHWRGVIVENHCILISLNRPSADRRMQHAIALWWNDGAPRCPKVKVGDTLVSVPPYSFNVAYVLTHATLHFLNEGIGLRQVCDWACLLQSPHTDEEKAEAVRLLKSFGLEKSARLFGALLVNCLGVSRDVLPIPFGPKDEKRAGWLLGDIWSGGNFGRYGNRRKQRPKGYWSGKWYTLVRLLNRCIEMGALSPGEAFWYPIMVAKHSFQMQWKRLTHRSTN